MPTCTDSTYAGDQLIPIASDGNRDCLLAQGNVGDGVWALQATLNWCYGQNGFSYDGIFGPQTRVALVNVQRRIGANPDGVYGPATRSRMVWFSRYSQPCQSVG
jgi:peptidoglycan hydrolase-like protein with peptidoglycan-binding domain